MSTPAVAVTRTSQMVPGAWYSLVGDDTFGTPMPPQLFYCKSKARQKGLVGRPFVHGTIVLLLGGKPTVHKDQMIFLDTINVYDDSSGMVNLLRRWRLPAHGRHLERHPDLAAAWRSLLRRAYGYHEILAEPIYG